MKIVRYNKFENFKFPEGYFLFPYNIAHVSFHRSGDIQLYHTVKEEFVKGTIVFADTKSGYYITTNHTIYQIHFDPNIVLITKHPEVFNQIYIYDKQGEEYKLLNEDTGETEVYKEQYE